MLVRLRHSVCEVRQRAEVSKRDRGVVKGVREIIRCMFVIPLTKLRDERGTPWNQRAGWTVRQRRRLHLNSGRAHRPRRPVSVGGPILAAAPSA